MVSKVLPPGFEDLENLVSTWSLATERERNTKHLSCSMNELKAVYNAVLPHAPAMLEHLRSLEAGDVRRKSILAESKNLFYLLLSLAEIAQSVEIHGQTGVVNGFEAKRWVPEHETKEWKALQQRMRPTLA